MNDLRLQNTQRFCGWGFYWLTIEVERAAMTTTENALCIFSNMERASGMRARKIKSNSREPGTSNENIHTFNAYNFSLAILNNSIKRTKVNRMTVRWSRWLQV